MIASVGRIFVEAQVREGADQGSRVWGAVVAEVRFVQERTAQVLRKHV